MTKQPRFELAIPAHCLVQRTGDARKHRGSRGRPSVDRNRCPIGARPGQTEVNSLLLCFRPKLELLLT
jgi:hypothetical protein